MLPVPMPVQPCPACGQPTPRHLDASSEDAWVHYYSCSSCHHIWTVDNTNPAKVTHVTPWKKMPPSHKAS